MCSRVKENVKKYPILLNNFKIKISGGNGFNIAQYNGTRREMLVNGEYLSFDNETPGTIPIYFTEIDEFVKTRNLNKTTFSRELERLLINIKINNGGLNVVYDNKPTMHTIYVVQIIETYIIQ